MFALPVKFDHSSSCGIHMEATGTSALDNET